MAETKSITISIPGKAHGKARPRMIRKTGVVYQPDPGNFQMRVSEYAWAAGLRPVEGPMKVDIVVYRRIPDSWSKKRKVAAMGSPLVGVPDAVNIEAVIHDALKAIAYFDDKQVSDASIRRRWSDQDMVMITVTEAE